MDSPPNSTQSITTHPVGSRERQDQIHHVCYPGQFFNISAGGAALNCDDMLIAMKCKDLDKETKNLEKKKDTIKKRQCIVREAKKIILEGGPKLKDDYILSIQWKHTEGDKAKRQNRFLEKYVAKL